MIRAVLLTALLAPLLAGCNYFGGWWGGQREEIITRPPPYYDRAEIDAINAEAECRRLARSQLEMQRCGVRR
jgi:hypothetical protein